jgi:hypothetical protein
MATSPAEKEGGPVADRSSEKAAAKPTARQVAESAAADGHKTGDQPKVTTMVGEQVGTEGYVAPGDAPANTWDASERLSTVYPSGEQAERAVKEGVGAMVSTVVIPSRPAQGAREGEDRVEQYDVTVNALTGETVRVEHNIDTGESRRV